VVHEIGDEVLAFWVGRLQPAMQRLALLVAAAGEAGQQAATLSRLAGLPVPPMDRIAREGWHLRRGLEEVTQALEVFAAGETIQRPMELAK
jgi:hypothetical protein